MVKAWEVSSAGQLRASTATSKETWGGRLRCQHTWPPEWLSRLPWEGRQERRANIPRKGHGAIPWSRSTLSTLSFTPRYAEAPRTPAHLAKASAAQSAWSHEGLGVLNTSKLYSCQPLAKNFPMRDRRFLWSEEEPAYSHEISEVKVSQIARFSRCQTKETPLK